MEPQGLEKAGALSACVSHSVSLLQRCIITVRTRSLQVPLSLPLPRLAFCASQRSGRPSAQRDELAVADHCTQYSLGPAIASSNFSTDFVLRCTITLYLLSPFFGLRNVTIVGFYYLLFTQLLHVPFVRPSSGRNMFTGNYSIDNGPDTGHQNVQKTSVLAYISASFLTIRRK
jgi:hypothetical protein